MSYGFTPRGEDSLNAKQVQTILNSLNYIHFGITTYRIYDQRMLPDSILTKYIHNTDVTKLLGHLKYKNSNNYTSTTAFRYPTCLTYSDETEWWYNPDGDNCNCSGDEYYSYSVFNYHTVCVDDPNSNGGNFFAGTNQTSSWWTGGGGGGSSPPPPPPPITRDSTYFKGLLNKYAVAIRYTSDSVFNVAQTRKLEYSFIITENSGKVYVRNIKTDNDQNAVSMNYRTTGSELLKGEVHTHQDDITNGAAQMRSSLDIADVYALWGFGNFSRQDFVSLVEMGDVRQVLVVEDPKKATAYINALGRTKFMVTYYASITSSPLYYTNFRQATLNATLAQLGNSSISGIGLYQTIDIGKVLFTKLN